MKKRHGKSQWPGALGALVALLCLLPTARAMVGYLPLLGPPPLRIWLATTNMFDYSSFEAELAAKALAALAKGSGTNPVAVPATNPNLPAAGETNELSVKKTATGKTDSTGTTQESVAGGQTESMRGGNFSFPAATASDLLTVTPQMIAQYLRPEPNTTNSMDRPGAVVFIPADLPFVPPPAKAGAESRATYHIK